jgi:zinc transport system ATP-binding protein
MNNNSFTNSQSLIEAREITVVRGEKTILSSASLKVRNSEIVTLIGPNGAGKTTMVRVILGLLTPDQGSIIRRPNLTIGYIPQKLNIDQTLPITVSRFLLLGAGPKSYSNEKQAKVLNEVGVSEILNIPLQAVSGGEFQRILLARALMRDPDLLVMDEPSQGIDISGQADLFRLITIIRNQRKCGVLMVSHDLHLVMAKTDEVICLNQHVCCSGHPETVANDPNYIQLFGKKVASTIAIYQHHHDHDHDTSGNVVPLQGDSENG